MLDSTRHDPSCYPHSYPRVYSAAPDYLYYVARIARGRVHNFRVSVFSVEYARLPIAARYGLETPRP